MTSTIIGTEGPDDLIGSSDVLVAELIFGLGGSDTIEGNGGQDSLFGGLDTDFLVGSNSNEWLFGGQGGDSLSAGGGADVVFGDIGNDNIRGGVNRIPSLAMQARILSQVRMALIVCMAVKGMTV
ncbi:MAG: hypothetical protein HC920_19310 [Oscillatoriales cyanobacterium SM2_3_0]|nr:hypothetical protein [Oscillatoriales cyanobacterium SM2_3_0]